MTVVWHDPTLIQREVWIGTGIIVTSMVFTIFSLYSLVIKRWLRGYSKFVVILGGWLVLFAVQFAYLAAHSVVIYGVYYNETSGEYVYATTPNPMAIPVVAVMVATAIAVIASVIVVHNYEVYRRIIRRAYYVE
jgi:multisubunit Na+/H+ antiporter MnhC subunit